MFGHDNRSPTANVGASVNYADSDLRSYADYYITRSPYIARSMALPTGRAYHYDMMVGDDDLMRTEYYNDYLRPRRLGHYGTGLIIERTRIAQRDRPVACGSQERRGSPRAPIAAARPALPASAPRVPPAPDGLGRAGRGGRGARGVRPLGACHPGVRRRPAVS